MTNLLYDTASGPDVIPKNAKAVAGYVDGEFQTFPKLVAAFFPHARCVSISTQGAAAEFIDIERGDPIPPQDAGVWVHSMILRGFYRPGVYCDESNLPAVRAALTGRGLKRNQYRLWMAKWGREPSLQDLKDHDVDMWQFLGFPDDRPDQSIYADDFFPAPKKKRVKLPAKPHPKVTAATIAAAITSAITIVVHSRGVKIDPAEAAYISTAAAAIGGYLFPTKKAPK